MRLPLKNPWTVGILASVMAAPIGTFLTSQLESVWESPIRWASITGAASGLVGVACGLVAHRVLRQQPPSEPTFQAPDSGPAPTLADELTSRWLDAICKGIGDVCVKYPLAFKAGASRESVRHDIERRFTLSIGSRPGFEIQQSAGSLRVFAGAEDLTPDNFGRLARHLFQVVPFSTPWLPVANIDDENRPANATVARRALLNCFFAARSIRLLLPDKKIRSAAKLHAVRGLAAPKDRLRNFNASMENAKSLPPDARAVWRTAIELWLANDDAFIRS